MSGLKQTVALVGMMGAGKSAVGRRLAGRLDVPFHDADAEIEAAAGCTINDIFEKYGEPAFRDCEQKVIARLLDGPPHILATGGGAFVDEQTRTRIKSVALSVWLNVPIDVLIARVGRRETRPMLRKGNPREIMTRLLAEREATYAEADIAIDSKDGPHNDPVDRIVGALRERGMLE
jgi:shikimate kinase